MYGYFDYPMPQNEPVLDYSPGSPEREELVQKLNELKGKKMDIPLIIGGQEIRTGDTKDVIMPHNHQHVLGQYHIAGKKEMKMAIDAAMAGKEAWESLDWSSRANIFLRAAELIAGPRRAIINASTMLEHSKTIQQADGDASAESVDIFKFVTNIMCDMYKEQPPSPPGIWNQVEYLPLEGFVLAISPFNFSACVALLAAIPAMAGNTVVWKPATSAVYSNYFIYKVLLEAGLPDGVINFMPCRSKDMIDVIKHPMMSAINFTGSTEVFQTMWTQVADNIKNYKCYPRLVGETGGKDFMFMHNSANKEVFVASTIRSAFEYQGQKCSCGSRAYVPASVWPEVKDMLIEAAKSVKMGDIEDLTNFMGAVTSKSAFDTITGYIQFAKDSPDAEIICGGGSDESKGYFIEPTLIVTKNPHFKTMEEEIFGPVFTIYVYDDDKLDEALRLCDETSPYGLTGGIYGTDRIAVEKIRHALRRAAGNIYVNDKTPGAVIAQQPFGGTRMSGTNDKVGKHNFLRWVSLLATKETLNQPMDYHYPYQG